MKQLLTYTILALLFLSSCSSHSVKEKINAAGEIAGQTAGEFAKGVGNGVTAAFDVHIALPPSLMKQGLALGKNTVSSDTTGTDNLLSAYLIFSKDFSGTLTAKVFDKNAQEMGRTSALVEGKAGAAKFVDFHFDSRTNIDSDCKITIE